MSVNDESVFRILVIDDMPSIHDDFRKVLGSADTASAKSTVDLNDLESQLFGAGAPLAAAIASGARYELDFALQGEAGRDKLRQALAEGRPYAMAFVDMRMPPGWDGVQTIRELWKLEPNLQVAICTAYSDHTPDQVAHELKLDGRMLILRKPFDKAEVRQLTAALCGKWLLAQRYAELERIVEARTAEFKHAALHDSLTKLPNRVLFADRLSRLLLQSRRDPSHKFAVLFIDVDEFKVVNDSLGHDAGDAVLLQVAERLSACLRETDTIANGEPQASTAELAVTARLGGDEFAVLLDNIETDADAARIAQRLVDAVDKPYPIKGHQVRCAISVGIATNGLAYARPEDILRDADTAMYHAKRAGRGRFMMFDRSMHEMAVARLTFESDLRDAIEHDHIQVHYQPIVETATQRVIGFEALARWEHPTRGWIAPDEFIPAAEETGMIQHLGLNVLEKACHQLAEWHASSAENRELTMSVNLSRKQLANHDIVDHVARVLRETGLSPRCLKLEITESCIMADARATVEVLKAIQRLDVQLHIDDFGTGYSSLSCLQMFPLSGLKIDRAFVREVTDNPSQATLLGAIVTMAHNMNMPLVSEGVETPEQAAMLHAMGCDFAQGYLFARPMDAAGASKFLGQQLATRDAARVA